MVLTDIVEHRENPMGILDKTINDDFDGCESWNHIGPKVETLHERCLGFLQQPI